MHNETYQWFTSLTGKTRWTLLCELIEYVNRNGYNDVTVIYTTCNYVRGYIETRNGLHRRMRYDNGRWTLCDGLRDATRTTRRMPDMYAHVDTTNRPLTG